MFFDTKSWHIVSNGEEIEVTNGQVQIMCDKEAQVYIFDTETFEKDTGKVDADENPVFEEVSETRMLVLGVGHHIKAQVEKRARIRVAAPEGALIQYYELITPTFFDDGEVYTNLDRKPLADDPFEGSARLRRLAELQERRKLAAEKQAKIEAQREAERQEQLDKEAADAQAAKDADAEKVARVMEAIKEQEIDGEQKAE